ncbi:MAG TPA: excinuclease ABC subunit UvrC [Clostridia bacterium]|nr:excinuclease ABC subunit UvrC [Clostridia bacterium]
MTAFNEKITYLLSTLPERPGVYLMKDFKGETIYVGKALNLKNRVSSYFTNTSGHSHKTKRMVNNIETFEYIVLDNERQAFLTESDLIKSLRPKFNILMKDDKSYPYIKITTEEEFPGIYITRKKGDKNARYFGPYPNRVSKRNTITLLQSAFMLRSCNKIAKRPCINYDMHLCLAPCSKDYCKAKYKEAVDSALRFLSGNGKELIEEYKNKMQIESDNLNFEKAAYYRDRINILTTISDSYALDTDQNSLDVIAYARMKDFISFFIMNIRNGKVSDKRTINIRQERIEETDIGYEFLRQYYDNNVPKEIVVYNEIANREDMEKWLSDNAKRKVKITIPQKGKLKKLADAAYENAVITLKLYMGQTKNLVDTSLIYSLASFLELETVPVVIEAFDISHLSGQDAVASKVVFKDGIPFKSGYRRYMIKGNNTRSDTDSMKEVLRRRMEKEDLPDLFLIDGGQNQVSAVLDIVTDKIPVAGMVKDEKHITRALIYNSKEYDLSSDMNLYVFISSIQNEAHRFAIEYNRKKRTKKIYESELDNIPGVGENIKIALLKHFGSVRGIKAAGEQQIADVKGIGQKTAKAIYNYFHKTQGG